MRQSRPSFVSSKDLLNGINIINYCRAHEDYVAAHMSAKDIAPIKLLRWHEQKISWLQHERLVHLLVTLLTTIIFLFVVAVYLCLSLGGGSYENAMIALVFAAVALLLLACYLFYYYRLENTVQHWYRIAEELHDQCVKACVKATGDGD